MSERVLGIFGAGGLGREVLELARMIHEYENRWKEVIFIVNIVTAKEINGVKVFEYEDAKKRYGSTLEVIVGIGEPKVRERVFGELVDDGIDLATLIHPDVHIPTTTVVGKGVVIQYGCFISCNVTIEDYVYIQPQCNIGHDDVLRKGCMISGFGNIAGTVTIGCFTYIGISAVLKEGVKIGNKSIIGMGSIVYKDIPDEMVALGSPARVIARNVDGKVFRH